MVLLWQCNIICSICLLSFLAGPLLPQANQDLKTKIQAIQREIEDIRGEKFKTDVAVQNQSVEEFGEYIDRALERQIPPDLAANYGRVVKKLGLYRGPEIKNFLAMARMVFQSQAAAYYDPSANTFYVVMQNLPDAMLSAVYAHELYHGFQDQRHDLDKYILSPADGKLTDDELLARQAVVEGEATYIMTLWTLKKMFGAVPDSSVLRMSINMQSQLSTARLLDMVKQSATAQAGSKEIGDALQALDKIPPFMVETMVGVYLKGMNFIFETQRAGWQKVDELYTRPPVSTEQILHPEKWAAYEQPYRYEWPDERAEPSLSGWKLLESNTLGELQWRIIFVEYSLESLHLSAADGWDGDSFMIFENKNDGRLLLLLYTSWDSDKDVREFRHAYEQLLKIKYPEQTESTRLVADGLDVLIIEGGDSHDTEEILAYLRKVKKVKN